MRLLFFVLLLSGLIVSLPLAAVAASPDIVISEVQITGDSSDDEFIELYNPGDSDVSLGDYALRRKTKGDTSALGTSVRSFSAGDIIPAGGFFLWANSKSTFVSLADTTTTGSLTDDNSLALLGKDNAVIDAITYGSGHAVPFSGSATLSNPGKKQSLVRDLDTLDWSKTSSPTPTNRSGIVFEEQEATAPVHTDSTVRINELLPDPKEKGEKTEYIELYNGADDAVPLVGWTIRDASKTGKYVFPDGTSIAGKGYLVITRETSGLSLNNSDEAVSLFDESGALVHSVRYGKTKENVSLNYSDGAWRGSKSLTPGKENILNNLPSAKERIPKKGYAKVPVEFSAKGKDKDKDKLKYTWDFGDGHKSYKRETSHTYKKKGTYTVRLTISDGAEDTVETKKVKISKYKHPDLKITELAPNPAGKDTDNEWLIIENKGRKKVNLRDFAIATGWKSLSNHPIRNDLFIEAGKTLRLSRKDSLFSLPNKQGKIELRAPDGKTLQKVKYQLASSVKENTVYRKEKDLPWTWVAAQTAAAPVMASVPTETLSLSKETAPPAQEIPTTPEQQEKEVTEVPPSAPSPETPEIIPVQETRSTAAVLRSIENLLSSLNASLNTFFIQE